MAVTETGRKCRRNGVANIFTGFDEASIEYLRSIIIASGGTIAPSLTNTTGDNHAADISEDVPSLTDSGSDNTSADNTDNADDDYDERDHR